MNLQALYDFVRTSLDSDSTELPDALLGVWERAAEARISERLGESSAYRLSNFTYTSTAGSSVLDITNVWQPFTVQSVNGPNWQLVPIEHEEALRRWPLNAADPFTAVTTGSPTHWSVVPANTVNDYILQIWLWPAPDAAEIYSFEGYTGAIEELEDRALSAVPSLPTEFHGLIGQYMVAKGSEMQSNVSVAAMQMNRFEGELDILQRKWNRPSRAATATIGGARSRTDDRMPWRLRYPFEPS